jgi:hypothetical protein
MARGVFIDISIPYAAERKVIATAMNIIKDKGKLHD